MASNEGTHERSIRTRQTIRILVWIVALGALIAVVVSNSQDVEIDWVFGESTGPLWIVIAGAALLGAVIGYVARWRRD